jgi:hypothetical protein
MRARATGTTAAVVLLVAAALTGCAPAVHLDPADDAIDPGCASVVVALPDELAGLDRRDTDAQGTGAWGEPAAVLLRCGVPVPDPTAEQPCLDVSGVDWLSDESDPDAAVFVLYGREPAVQVVVDSGADAFSVLAGLTDAVSGLEQVRECVGPDDVG